METRSSLVCLIYGEEYLNKIDSNFVFNGLQNSDTIVATRQFVLKRKTVIHGSLITTEMSNERVQETYLDSTFPEKSIPRFCTEQNRRTSGFTTLKGVDASFHHILKLFCNQSPNELSNQEQIISSLVNTMQIQGECIVKVIRDEVDFLECNKKSFPDDFVEQNVSAYQYWEQFFSLVGTKPVTSSAITYVLATQEAFMLFMEFCWSVDSVLKTWPIPVGFSYLKVSDKLDVFFDSIPPPPDIAYSLVYRPKLGTKKLKSVIVGEYEKAATYLSTYLNSVKEVMLLMSLGNSHCSLRLKFDYLMSTMFKPIKDKLTEYAWKVEEIDTCDYRMDLLQAERVYASERVLVAYEHLKTLNAGLQAKIAKYQVEFYLGFKKKLSDARQIVQRTHQRDGLAADAMKDVIFNLLRKWENTLDDVITLNRVGVLDVITNVHVLETEIRAYLSSLQNE